MPTAELELLRLFLYELREDKTLNTTDDVDKSIVTVTGVVEQRLLKLGKMSD